MRPAQSRRGPTVPLKHRSLPKQEAAAVFSVFFRPNHRRQGSRGGEQVKIMQKKVSILPLEDLRYEASYTKITTSDYAAVCLAAADGTPWKKNMLHSSNTEVDQQ